MLFDFGVFGDFPVIFLWLIFSLILLWSDNILGMIFKSFKFVMVCFMIQSKLFLVNDPRGIEKNMYSTAVGWRILLMSMRSCCLVILFSSFYIIADFPCSSLLIAESGVLKSLTVSCRFVYLSFQSYQFLLYVFWSIIASIYTFQTGISSWNFCDFPLCL